LGHNYQNAKWIRPGAMVTSVALAIFAVPAIAQPGIGHASTGHVAATNPAASARSVAPAHYGGPGRIMNSPIHSGQRMGTVRANSFGASSAPPPSWELPRTVTPHWEIGPNVPIEPNQVQGNRVPNHRFGNGVGFLGFPYYADPLAFVDADNVDDAGNNTVQQAQPDAPAAQDYAPQTPYAEVPYDEGYPPPRAPYTPQGYPPPPQNGSQNNAQSAASLTDGLDHPAVTLVFNDGRQPVKVHSYVLTGSSVLVAENGHQRVIPMADLDLPATIAQNREAGVDFELPGGSR
jgi:hypothetical protein